MDEDFYYNNGTSTEECLIVPKKNSSIILDTHLYGGIPETLILNVISWILFILLFTVLRQQAWDYGRLALVNNSTVKKRWTQLFYAHGTDIELSSSPSSNGTSSQNTTVADGGIFSWIWITLKLSKEQILLHSGPDAVHYLSFQMHLIVVMAIITIVSVAIILPVNYQGTLSSDVHSLMQTTISNLKPESKLLWIHVFVAIVYVPLVVLIMRRASGRNAFKTASTRTIMITNISKNDCNKSTIRNHITELFPDIEIEEIELAYNIAKLTEIAEDFERTVEARTYCEFNRNRVPPLMAKQNCLSCKTVDALEYYQHREHQLGGEVARLKASALNEPLGIAFVTVISPIAARNIIKHFKKGSYHEWNLSYAPAPSDIFWEHLNVGNGLWYVKWSCVNIILFLVLFFLTTPIYIVNMLHALPETLGKVSPLISEFLPTLLLWTLAALMPVIVSYSDKWLSHWTRSRQNYSIMTKTFGYLLFMILILPSLGLTSAQAFMDWTIHLNSNESTFRWECIFLPDKGAFFVNYVITAAFIGTSLELLRFPDLIVYIWKLCTAKSRAETSHIRKSIVLEFPFGIHYAWTVMVFTMTTVYSVICPIIMPFAMVYIVLKHFGDRHNLYFAYGPSNMISQGGGKIHSTAVTMTKFSVIILLLILAGLATVRGGRIDARAVILVLALFLTLTMFAFMSPIKKCTTKRPSIEEPDSCVPVYVPRVLLNDRMVPFQISPSHLGYGSDSPNRNEENISEEHDPIRVIT